MGYNKIDFSNAILGESRKKSDFVVLEQDVTVSTRVSQALANLALFEKSQVIRSYGTGVYVVDLSALVKESDVAVDEVARLGHDSNSACKAILRDRRSRQNRV